MTVGYTLLLYDYFLTIEDEVSVALSLRVVTYYLFPLIGRIYLEIALDSREDYLFVEALWDTLWSNCHWNPSKWFIPWGLARSRSLCIGMGCLPIFLLQACEGYGIFLGIYHLLSLEFAHSKSTALLFMHTLTPGRPSSLARMGTLGW